MPIQWITLQIEVGVDFKLHPFMLIAVKIHRTLSQALHGCILYSSSKMLSLESWTQVNASKKYQSIKNTVQIVTAGPACLE